ncbi:hypothetical protein AB9K41_28835 [Cribrihabitans sp. XS_ASV171]
MTPNRSLRALALTLLCGVPLAGAAEPAGLSIELSSATDVSGACQMSFVATNETGQDITRAVYEVVLFGADGGVAQLSLLDFRDLPKGRPRVRQFQFDGMDCDQIPRVLINGAQTCEGAETGGCIDALRLSTRTGTELVG